jgi:Lipocalin-like domain
MIMKKVLLAGLTMASLSFVGFNHQSTKGNDFTGLWDLVSVESIAADNSVTYPYGEKPSGRMMIDEDGNYMVEIFTTARAKIISGNKSTATPEENAMMVRGSNAHYGKMAGDPGTKTLLFKVQQAFFPNWEGQDLKSAYSLENGVLKSYSSNTTFGGSKAIVTWEKKK